MTREYLKKATLTSASGASDVHDTVVTILDDIKAGGDAKAMEYAAKFDQYDGNVLLTQAELQLDSEQYEQALATLRRLDENSPNHSHALALMGKLYFRLKD